MLSGEQFTEGVRERTKEKILGEGRCGHVTQCILTLDGCVVVMAIAIGPMGIVHVEG